MAGAEAAKNKRYKLLERCKVCGSKDLTDVIHIAPQFLSPTFTRDNAEEGDLAKIQVPFTMTLCDVSKNPNGCGLLQLREEVEADLLYRRYFYRSATSDMMRNDLKDVIRDIMSRVDLKPKDIVVDIGANDCTTLGFYPANLRRVGYEPARNIDWSGVDKNITIINDYFAAKPFAERFKGEKAKAVGCNAMFYDLPDPNSFTADVKSILAPDGVWCIQLSYLSLMLTNMNFYDICHEHLSYYSLAALQTLMQRNGLTIFDASTNHVNGGSLRAFVTHTENKKAFTEDGAKRLAALAEQEEELKVADPQTYRNYYAQIEDLAKRVNTFLDADINKGGKVFGLGASTKGNVLLQFFGITKDKMPYISERNPDKVGLRTLGTDFELISEERARELGPSSMLVLPWYFKDEIVAREKEYLDKGGKLVIPMPYAHVVTKDGERKLYRRIAQRPVRPTIMSRIPLNKNMVGSEEIAAAKAVLDSGNLTMGERCRAFERAFADYLGVSHAVMVNSGSSANLLAMFALANPLVPSGQGRPSQIKSGAEVIVPALTWSTTIWPVVQIGAKPVFVDCDPRTLQMQPEAIEKAITPNTAAIVVVHVLGGAGNAPAIAALAKKHNIWLFEDTCESLGVRWEDKPVGTFGQLGSYSFYFSHHITTIEGGMVVTDDGKVAELLRAMRAHGWARNMDDPKKVAAQHPDIDPRFLFVTTGFNLRPMEINAAIGLIQLKKLDGFNENRRRIAARLDSELASLDQSGDLSLIRHDPRVNPAPFGYTVLCQDKKTRNGFVQHLETAGIETRPVICGNLVRQPALSQFDYSVSGKLDGADRVMDCGLYWGSHPDMTDDDVGYIVKTVKAYFQ